MSNSDGSRRPLQSVDRAVSVLETLAERGEAGVTELARELDVHKSTIFRVVVALEDRGLVEQTPNRRYQLGVGLVRLASAAPATLDIAEQSQPVCEELAARLDETANVAIYLSRAVVNISQAHGSSLIAAVNWVGARTPWHATSSGRALVAHLPEARVDELLAEPRERFTEWTIVDAGELRADLARIRERGYAYTNSEFEDGLTALAAPVRGAHGGVIAALSVSSPSFRLDQERAVEIAPVIVEYADQLSARMGFFGRRHPEPTAHE